MTITAIDVRNQGKVKRIRHGDVVSEVEVDIGEVALAVVVSRCWRGRPYQCRYQFWAVALDTASNRGAVRKNRTDGCRCAN